MKTILSMLITTVIVSASAFAADANDGIHVASMTGLLQGFGHSEQHQVLFQGWHSTELEYNDVEGDIRIQTPQGNQLSLFSRINFRVNQTLDSNTFIANMVFSGLDGKKLESIFGKYEADSDSGSFKNEHSVQVAVTNSTSALRQIRSFNLERGSYYGLYISAKGETAQLPFEKMLSTRVLIQH